MSSNHKPTTLKQQKIWLVLMRMGRKCGCHQMATRSFFYKNFQYPLCARCTGIFIGQFFIAPIILILGYNNLILNIVLFIPLVIDGLLQYFKIIESNNLRRLVTGLMAGYSIMSITVYMILLLVSIF